MTIAVASIAATTRLLDEHNVNFRRLDDGVLVPASQCGGAFIHFVPEG